MKARAKAAGALDRPAMPAAPTARPRPRSSTTRITVDLDEERYLRLRQWALDTKVPASVLVTALLDVVEGSVRRRAEVEAIAREILDGRRSRSVGQ
ncbi:MAG TPA: hypothetical protein VJM49_13640 [Acidimicrobiales bacterium]|nr:hypothetical protein [Acidimicrobiales bacterium]